MSKPLDIDAIRARLAAQRMDEPMSWYRQTAYIAGNLLAALDEAQAENDRLRGRLSFLDTVADDPDAGWCDRHPRRVEAATAGMIGRDTTDGDDLCLACEVERLEDEVRRLRADAKEAGAKALEEAAADCDRFAFPHLRTPANRQTAAADADYWLRARAAAVREGGQP